jgi:hypothetical protein
VLGPAGRRAQLSARGVELLQRIRERALAVPDLPAAVDRHGPDHRSFAPHETFFKETFSQEILSRAALWEPAGESAVADYARSTGTEQPGDDPVDGDERIAGYWFLTGRSRRSWKKSVLCARVSSVKKKVSKIFVEQDGNRGSCYA